jgi:very-short-patch-repair endonuclease
MRHFTRIQTSAEIEARARQLASRSTPSEEKLFAAIRGGRIGCTVRRQVALGRYVVDLLIPSRKLVIEVDGKYHERRLAADVRRDRWLTRRGYRVLRLSAELVLADVEQAVARIRAALAEPP